jgi:hypothetical protein
MILTPEELKTWLQCEDDFTYDYVRALQDFIFQELNNVFALPGRYLVASEYVFDSGANSLTLANITQGPGLINGAKTVYITTMTDTIEAPNSGHWDVATLAGNPLVITFESYNQVEDWDTNNLDLAVPVDIAISVVKYPIPLKNAMVALAKANMIPVNVKSEKEGDYSVTYQDFISTIPAEAKRWLDPYRKIGFA